MYKIKNHVREEFRQNPDYLLELESLMKMLEMEKDLDIYCAHEAGHVIYFLKGGGNEAEFVYHGPTIYFDPVTMKFCSCPCGVEKSKEVIKNNVDLEAFAKISVAGGVFEKELENSNNPGEKDDRQKLHAAYAIADGIIPTRSEQTMWEWAQEEVRLELANGPNRIEARNRAEDIKVKCFQAHYSDSSEILFL